MTARLSRAMALPMQALRPPVSSPRAPRSALKARASTAHWPLRLRRPWLAGQPDAQGLWFLTPADATVPGEVSAEEANARPRPAPPAQPADPHARHNPLWRRCSAATRTADRPPSLIAQALSDVRHALVNGLPAPAQDLAGIQRWLMHRFLAEGAPPCGHSLALLPLVYLNMARPRCDRQRSLAAQRLVVTPLWTGKLA